ncbi:MAG: hypothetical protein IJB73_01235 [Firmicutes bacterium]|nr:hypothetical protein [Bacillota bacterium]
MNELLDKVIEFCSDNQTMIAGAAGILLVIILLGIFISNKVKSRPDDKEREFFLEGEYDSMIRETAHAKKAGAQPEAAEEVSEPEAQPEPVQPEELQPEVPQQEELVPEDLMDEDEFQPVHININIERGQVKIGYDEDGKITCMVESDETEASEETMQAPAEETEGGKEELLSVKDGIVLEKINIVKAAPVKKFGPDNFNTGRSGRIFTEEELQQQIKD